LRGIDVITAQEAGRCGFHDSKQLDFSTQEGRVIVTFDSDYRVLRSSGISHAGIAWAPVQKYSIGGVLAALILLHAVYSADDMLNQLEYL
jgi:hypothetical protein